LEAKKDGIGGDTFSFLESCQFQGGKIVELVLNSGVCSKQGGNLRICLIKKISFKEQIKKEYGDWNKWQNEVKDTQKQAGEKVKWIYGVFKEIVDSVELDEAEEEEIKVCEEGCVPVGKVPEDDKNLIYDLKFSKI